MSLAISLFLVLVPFAIAGDEVTIQQSIDTLDHGGTITLDARSSCFGWEWLSCRLAF